VHRAGVRRHGDVDAVQIHSVGGVRTRLGEISVDIRSYPLGAEPIGVVIEEPGGVRVPVRKEMVSGTIYRTISPIFASSSFSSMTKWFLTPFFPLEVSAKFPHVRFDLVHDVVFIDAHNRRPPGPTKRFLLSQPFLPLQEMVSGTISTFLIL
jgi:hypothetical protein